MGEVPVLKRFGKKTFLVFSAYNLILMITGAAFSIPETKGKVNVCKVMRSMARVYMAHGDYDKAQGLAEKALRMAENEPADKGVCDLERSSCLIDLAYLLNNKGKLGDAEKTCIAGLEIQKKVLYKNHPYIAGTLRILSSIYEQQGKYRKARTALDEAIEIMQQGIEDEQAMASLYVDMGRLMAAQGDFEQAQDYYLQVRELIENSYGTDHLYTAGVYGSIAELYTFQGRYAEAEELINKALGIKEKVFGPDHHLLITTWLTMAKIYQANEDYEKAETILNKALKAAKDQRGDEHPLVGKIMNHLTQLYITENEYGKAEEFCKGAIEVLEDSLGADNEQTATAYNNLAKIYIHKGKISEAEKLCEKALNTLENTFDYNHPKVVAVLETMIQLERKVGNATEAAKLEERVAKIRESRKASYGPIAKTAAQKMKDTPGNL